MPDRDRRVCHETGPLLPSLSLLRSVSFSKELELPIPFAGLPTTALPRPTGVAIIVFRLRLPMPAADGSAGIQVEFWSAVCLEPMCVDRHQWRVLISRLPHTPTLPGRRGFLLRPVARLPRPRVLSTTRKSATLCPYPLRVLLIGRGFIAPPGDLRCQNSRASSGKAYDLPACRPASHRFDTAGYRVSLAQACSTLSPMPYSRFAVRYVRRFYLMLPPDPSSLTAPLPCWCRPSVRSRWAVLLPVDIHQKVGQYAMPSTLVSLATRGRQAL